MELWIPKPASVGRKELLWNYSIALSATALHRYLLLFVGTKRTYFQPIAWEQIGKPPFCVIGCCPIYDPTNLMLYVK
jgi:hypothetical protein